MDTTIDAHNIIGDVCIIIITIIEVNSLRMNLFLLFNSFTFFPSSIMENRCNVCVFVIVVASLCI